MSRRGGRKPTEEEIGLWRRVTESIAPLKPLPAPPVEAGTPPAEERRAAARPATPQPKARAKGPATANAAPALAPIDRRTRARLVRGRVAIDARIDLHGLTQAAAHARLKRFLEKAQADGAATVLVITGKGRGASDAGAEGGARGVLKRMAPHWLAAADLRPLVVGFDTAAAQHGGEGALYVRIRRKRG